jgi:hypothetical protein
MGHQPQKGQMNEPKQIELFEQNVGRIQRQVEYVPSDPSVIKEYVRSVCAEFGEQNPAYHNPEVVSGFASFLVFVSERLAKYMSNGHEEYLLKGYQKAQKKR